MSHPHSPRATHLTYLHSANNKGETPTAVDTTEIVAGATSRNVPKTIGGQWQAVKPPWGRLLGTVPDNHRATAYFSNSKLQQLQPTYLIILPQPCHISNIVQLLAHGIHNLSLHMNYVLFH
jgi:hypothetical protein